MIKKRSDRRRATTNRPTEAASAQTAQIIDRVTYAALLAVAFLLGCTYLRDYDIWWHLRTGQLIVERGEIPQTDWFTYIDFDQPWIDLHWGFQLIVAGLYAIGGAKLLTLAKAFCLAGTITIAWGASGRNLPVWLKTLCWLLPLICISGRANERPEILSLLFLATWMWILARVDRQPRLIWLLPIVQILWVNCHGLFVLGLVVGGAYVIDRLQRSMRTHNAEAAAEDSKLTTRTLLWAAAATIVASLVNPYFEQGALFPLVLFRKMSVDHDFYSTRIGEFQQPWEFVKRNGFSNIYLIAEAFLWILTTASFIWLALHRRVQIGRLLLFLAYSFLAWQASRNTAIFALVAGVVLCANCSEIHELRRLTDKSIHDASIFPRAIVLTVLVAFAATIPTNYWAAWGGEAKRFGLGEEPDAYWFAHGAAEFAGQEGMPANAFVSHIGQAAPYIFHNGPNRRVFMDGRLEVSTRATFEKYEQILAMMSITSPQFRPTAEWEPLIRDPQGLLPAVILDSRHSRNQINGLMATPTWRLVFADPAAAVFLDAATADRLALPMADPTPLLYPPGTSSATR